MHCETGRSGFGDIVLDPLVKVVPAAHYDYWCVPLGEAMGFLVGV